MGQDGYASLRDVLKHDSLNELGVTQRELEEVAQSNDKDRYQLQWRGGHLYIQARQGHSISVSDDLTLRKLSLPSAIHGTYLRHYPAIFSQGLKAGGARGSRKHVHFAKALPGEPRLNQG